MLHTCYVRMLRVTVYDGTIVKTTLSFTLFRWPFPRICLESGLLDRESGFVRLPHASSIRKQMALSELSPVG
jgi:hypothetical protein